MRGRGPGHVVVSPAAHGWRIVVEGPERREGVVRARSVLTWMQQRRAVEERLRSWDVALAPDAAWVQRPDGTYRLPIVDPAGTVDAAA